MNNLHRELAPISDGAWAQIEEEATRTLKRHLAGRRVHAMSGGEGQNTQIVGNLLYGQYMFPFEIASLLLLVAIIGAVVMAKKRI